MRGRLLALGVGVALAAGVCVAPSGQALVPPPLIDQAVPPPAIADGIGPLSGRATKGDKQVLVVKVDNVTGSTPQAGLNQADIVWVEEVEGGLTRLAAVFSSRMPTMVGPVRSARTDNVQLLSQLGRPTIAYSGANKGVLRTIHRSTLRSAEAEVLRSPYRRIAGYRNPHDLFLTNVKALLRKRPASKAFAIGFTFAKQVTGGRPARHETIRFPRATLRFDYDRASHRWLLTQDGHQQRLRDGSRVGADTVVVQHIVQRRDINGHITPFNETIGTGKVTLLRDGRQLTGTWVRNTVEEGTRFYDAAGKDIPLHVGTTWIVLLPDRDASARAS